MSDDEYRGTVTDNEYYQLLDEGTGDHPGMWPDPAAPDAWELNGTLNFIERAEQRDRRRRNAFKTDHNPIAVERSGTLMKSKQMRTRVLSPQRRIRRGERTPKQAFRQEHPYHANVRVETVQQGKKRQEKEHILRTTLGILRGNESAASEYIEREGRFAHGFLKQMRRGDDRYFRDVLGDDVDDLLYTHGQSRVCITTGTRHQRAFSASRWAYVDHLPDDSSLIDSIDTVLRTYAAEEGMEIEHVPGDRVYDAEGTFLDEHIAIERDIRQRAKQRSFGYRDSPVYWIKSELAESFATKKNTAELSRWELSNSRTTATVTLRYHTRWTMNYRPVFQIYELEGDGIPQRVLHATLDDSLAPDPQRNGNVHRRYVNRKQFT